MTTARRVAFDLLTAVDEEDAYANLVLPKLLATARLEPRDAGFATELGYGSLRMRGFLDAVIEQVSSRALEDIDVRALRLLELGAYQLLFMKVGAHAAVSETVSLSRTVRAGGAAGFINAALRRVSERNLIEWRDRLSHALDPYLARAAITSHPDWIIVEFEASLARAGNADGLDAVLAADNAAPAVNLVHLPGFECDLTGVGEPNAFSPVGLTATGGNPGKLTEQTGLRVQDEGSQLTALALSRARPVRPGERWLDMCAGPGGKAALLAAEARLAGATLVANEVSAHRAELVRSALLPIDSSIDIRQADGRSYPHADERFDRILLDAPCSGLGALRRRPEARWRKEPEDLSDLVELQVELIDAALASLTDDGVLAYVTCSPAGSETFDQVERLLETGKAKLLDTARILDEVSLRPLDAALTFAESDGTAVQLWPHRHGTDGMFIALLTRA